MKLSELFAEKAVLLEIRRLGFTSRRNSSSGRPPIIPKTDSSSAVF
jgi:hypothetical protein